MSRDLEGDKFESTTDYSLTDEGLVYSALTVDGTSISIEPPKVQLPRDPRVGAKWSGEHVVGTKKQKRACDIAAYAKCDEGIVVTCVTTYEDARTVTVRNRYCGSIGYVGSDSVVQRSDGKTLKTSEENVKDAE